MAADPILGVKSDPMRGAAAELAWLQANPAFEERPATLKEFLGDDYLKIESYMRKRIVLELAAIMGETVGTTRPTKYPLAIVTGGIGIGKTTIASIVLPYLAHWLLCLKNPQAFFDLMPGSRIALMQMSTSEKQALEVIFQDIKARLANSPWFTKWPPAPKDAKFTNQIRLPKDIWIIPGDSAETTFEGYNILGGILDEADSHKLTANKDYAEQGFKTIDNRISSRFQDRGFLLVIGQMKSDTGFAARKYREFSARPDAYAVRLAIWDSFGDDYYEKDANGNTLKFTYDVRRKQIVPPAVSALMGDSPNHLRIPIVFKRQFETHPEDALRDLAGMPPAVKDPFISLVIKIEEARDRWMERYDNLGSPVGPDKKIAPWFRAHDTIKRVVHLDIAYAEGGDSYGIAMGHVPSMVERDGELKPVIVFDLLMRWRALAGAEIFLAEVRNFVYTLKDSYGFRISKVTMDGFESVETRQQFKRKRIDAEQVSIDRTTAPYHDLREALYEDRIEFPPYLVDIENANGTERVEIAYKELSELVDTGRKIDHPLHGSKDVADAMAGVTFTLMGDRRYRRNVISLDQARQHKNEAATGTYGFAHPAFLGDSSSIQAPIPPKVWSER